MARVKSWRVARYAAQLTRPLASGHGAWPSREGCFVAAFGASGAIGLGEAAPLPAWGTEDADAACRALGALGPLEVGDVAGLLTALGKAGLKLAETPAAHAAAEGALLDLLAREAGVPLARLLAGGEPVKRAVEVNALIDCPTAEAAARQALEWVASGVRVLKLKLTGGVATDLARVAAVRAAVGPRVTLRLDANGPWPRPGETGELGLFAPYDIAYVEEPVKPGDLSALTALVATCPVHVAADESAHWPGGLAAVLAAGVAAVVLKPAALGGLLRTRACVAIAQKAGVPVVLTSALDRGVATAGALHLAATLSGLPAAGLATGGLFEAGPALAGLVPQGGSLHLPNAPGLGFTPLDPLLTQWQEVPA